MGRLSGNAKKKERESESRRASDGSRWLSCHEEERRERERRERIDKGACKFEWLTRSFEIN